MSIHRHIISNIVDHNIPLFLSHLAFTGLMYWFTVNKILNKSYTFAQYCVFIYACAVEIIYCLTRMVQIIMHLGFPRFAQTKYHLLSTISVCAHTIILVLILVYFYSEHFVGFFFGALSYFGKLIIKSSYQHSNFEYDCIVTSGKYNAEHDKILNSLNTTFLTPHTQTTPLMSTYVTINVQTDECAICLSQFGRSDDVVDLPCKHTFHRDCVLRWFREKTECPVCRRLAR